MELSFRLEVNEVRVMCRDTRQHLATIDPVQGGIDIRNPHAPLLREHMEIWDRAAWVSVIVFQVDQMVKQKSGVGFNADFLNRQGETFRGGRESEREVFMGALPEETKRALLEYWSKEAPS